MTSDEFVKLVARMREAQKGFFKSQSGSKERQEFLQKSKQLEKQVDDEIKRSETFTGQEKLFS